MMMGIRMLTATLLTCSALAPSSGQGTLADATARQIDSAFNRFAPDGPGCALGVFQNGRIIYEHGYGSANIEYSAPITPRTPFIMGSVSKQFTAAAIALLVQRGRISLDDDVRKYVPELPDYGQRITIDELVHHTSGVRDFWALVDAAGMRFDDGYTVADVVRLAARQKHLNFPPGTEYNYSNTGYVLLGVVVQRASGMSLRDFAAKEIFGPLGMADSHYQDDHNEPVRGRAMAYTPIPQSAGWHVDVWNNDIVGQGGVMTTVEDLQKWDENFYTGRVGGPAFLKQQLAQGKLANGTTLAYAFGLEVGEYRGLPTVDHSGSTGGYRTDLIRFPGEHASVVTLCNTTTADASGLARRVADVVLAARFTKPAPSPQRVAAAQQGGAPATLSAATLASLAGRYHSDELDATYDVAATSSALIVRRPRGEVDTLRAAAPDLFRTRGYTVHFGSSSAAPGTFTLDNGRVRGIEFIRER